MNKIEIDGVVDREPRRFATKTGGFGLGFTLVNTEGARKLYVSVTMWDPDPSVEVRQGDHVVVVGQLVNRKMSNMGVTGNDVWEKAITAYAIDNLNLKHAKEPEMRLQPLVNHPDSEHFTESDLPF